MDDRCNLTIPFITSYSYAYLNWLIIVLVILDKESQIVDPGSRHAGQGISVLIVVQLWLM